MAGARIQRLLQGLGGAVVVLLSGGALMFATVLAGITMPPEPVKAASAAKPKKAVRPEWMAEVDRLQHLVAERARFAAQIDPNAAYDVLLRSSSFRKQYARFKAELKDQEVAWVMARKYVEQDLATQRYFIEHSGGKHPELLDVEVNLRCYVDDETAARLKEAPAAEKVLCVGKIVDFDFFRNFLAIGVASRGVVIGSGDIEKQLGQLAKLKK